MITAKHKDMGKTWTAKEEEQLIELYEKYQGENESFLAYKVKNDELIGGRSINAITTKLRHDWGVKSVGSPRMIAHRIDYKAIYEAHLNGCTSRQIAKDFGISHTSVNTAIEKYRQVNGIECEDHKKAWTPEEDKRLLEFVNNNTRWNQDVMWSNLKPNDGLPSRTKIALNRRWIKHLKQDRQWNGKEWVKGVTPKTKVTTTKVKTTRRTFLWGAFTIETIEA